jgi:hypothetical protein
MLSYLAIIELVLKGAARDGEWERPARVAVGSDLAHDSSPHIILLDRHPFLPSIFLLIGTVCPPTTTIHYALMTPDFGKNQYQHYHHHHHYLHRGADSSMMEQSLRLLLVRSTPAGRYLHSILLLALSTYMLWHLLGVSVVDRSSSSLSSISTTTTSSCRAIIDHRGTFSHSEILESLLADFPIDLPARCGNSLTVDIYFNVWLPCRTCSRITEFMNYANHQFQQHNNNADEQPPQYGMRGRTYVGYQGQRRTLGRVERRMFYTTRFDDDLIATIYTSAYCRYPFIYEIQHNPKSYAVFHESCAAVHTSPHAYWPNPMHPRYFFPNRLPLFSDQQKDDNDDSDVDDVDTDEDHNGDGHDDAGEPDARLATTTTTTDTSGNAPRPTPPPVVYNFCVVGNTARRSYHLLDYYYRYNDEKVKQEEEERRQLAAVDVVDDGTTTTHDNHHQNERFSVSLLGRGPIPAALTNHQYTQYRINSFLQYQEHIARHCHVILGLVDQAEHGDYFNSTMNSKRKLSGSIPQASAYRIPMVLHEELYDIYRRYLPAHVEIHGEDPHSFALAMDRMLTHLDQTTTTITNESSSSSSRRRQQQ